MSTSISEMYRSHSYRMNVNQFKNKMQQTGKRYQSSFQRDTAVISEEGKKALQNKMSVFAGTGAFTEVRKLSSVSSFGYCNDFEKILSEISNGPVSDDFVTENYSQEKVDALKTKFIPEEEAKTDSFECHVNKMVSAYNLMKDTIEEKYANPDRELEYYVADDGSIQELTREKELEMLDRAYKNHSEFMATSTGIWAELKDFQPQITYGSSKNKADIDYGSKNSRTSGKKNEIKSQTYQAFMSAISSENRNMLLSEQGSWNQLKLNLGISSSPRSQINSIWNYYAEKKLSVSDKGKEYYRSSIRQEEHESYETVLQRKEQLKGISMIDYSLELQKKAVANAGENVLSVTDKAESYVKAYTDLYDEIVQGYENGTREIYVQDENGTHKLTKDEELSALDSAYKKTVDDFVAREKTNQHARVIISKEMEKISKITSRSALVAAYLEEQKTRGVEEIPDDLAGIMYRAVASVKERYK